MAKISRNVLKDIVKECLVEILAEGLIETTTRDRSASLDSMLSESTKKRPGRRRKSSAESQANPAFDSAVAGSVKTLTDDSVMASIFADTAKTTLQEQLGAESKGPALADRASRQMDQLDPIDAFGQEGNPADHWAKLAFADSRPGQNNK